MLFNTGQYGLFFLVVFIVHWSLPCRWRRPFLLLASYYFYASAIPQYLPLILGLTAFGYGMGRWIAVARGRTRRAALWIAVAGNLGSLAYFKYSQLIASSLQPLLRHMPLLGPLFHDSIVLNIILPLGISFFTFEFIHYVVEVYKGREPITNGVDFALFAAFFPTQIAGPIKRFPDFVKQLKQQRTLREVDFDGGIGLILRGLLKKVLVADTLAPLVAAGFARPERLGWLAAWISVLAFATQIYGDFSGYTDMGRGSATLLGYSVPENFNRPYQAASPTEFWHRWHMSLSTWLRDYLYIPLGGSRVSRPRIYLNLMITMALGGLWHGASWHFMVWGVYQGALLCAHRLWERSLGVTTLYQRLMRVPVLDFMRRPVTLGLVCAGWVFFRASTLSGALAMLWSMVALDRPAMAGLRLAPGSTQALVLAGAAMVVVAGWLWAVAGPYILRLRDALAPRVDALWLRGAYVLGLRPAAYLAAVGLLVLWPPHAVQRFIYFQF